MLGTAIFTSLAAWRGRHVGLSIGGMTLLLMMIGRSAVSVVASLFYLVPPVVAVLAFLIFGKALSVIQIAGLLVASVGVAITTRG